MVSPGSYWERSREKENWARAESVRKHARKSRKRRFMAGQSAVMEKEKRLDTSV
jgi:hypothetical protein